MGLQLMRDSGDRWHVVASSDMEGALVHPLCKRSTGVFHGKVVKAGEPLPGGKVCRRCLAELGRAIYSLGNRLPEGK